MTNLIDKIENEIFEQVCTALDNDLPEPKVKVVFSPKGYYLARSEDRTVIYFDREFTKVAGYPYEINDNQAEDFKVLEIDDD